MNLLSQDSTLQATDTIYPPSAQASRLKEVGAEEDRALTWDEAWSFYYYTGLRLLFSTSKGISIFTA